MDVGLSQNLGSDPAVFHGIEQRFFGLEAEKNGQNIKITARYIQNRPASVGKCRYDGKITKYQPGKLRKFSFWSFFKWPDKKIGRGRVTFEHSLVLGLAKRAVKYSFGCDSAVL